MKMRRTSRFLSKLAKFVRDDKGQILLLFAILVPVIMAVIGLTLEVGRFRLLNNQLQNLADGAALAGAKQLDGHSGAIADAKRDAQNLENPHWWSQIDMSVHLVDGEFVFYSKLKCVPDCDIAPRDVTATGANADRDARFIKVRTEVGGIFPAFLAGLPSFVADAIVPPKGTDATATAGASYVFCNVQPLMLCNPYEQQGEEFHATPGDLYAFTATGSTGGYSPGDFALLDPAGQTHSGAGTIEKLLAALDTGFCYTSSGVSPAQGQKTIKLANGVNVRFDIRPQGGGPTIDLNPAHNILKGDYNDRCLTSNQVQSPPGPPPANIDLMPDGSTPGAALPIETGLLDPSRKIGSSYFPGLNNDFPKFWNGDAADKYWQAHHESTGRWPGGSSNPLTRYEVYKNELNNAYPWINQNDPGIENYVVPSTGTCTGASPTDATFERACIDRGVPGCRRIISVAVVNCISQNINGNNNSNVMTDSYAEFFVTRPVDQNGLIYAEFVRFMTPQSGSVVHKITQLYRDYCTEGPPQYNICHQ